MSSNLSNNISNNNCNNEWNFSEKVAISGTTFIAFFSAIVNSLNNNEIPNVMDIVDDINQKSINNDFETLIAEYNQIIVF